MRVPGMTMRDPELPERASTPLLLFLKRRPPPGPITSGRFPVKPSSALSVIFFFFFFFVFFFLLVFFYLDLAFPETKEGAEKDGSWIFSLNAMSVLVSRIFPCYLI